MEPLEREDSSTYVSRPQEQPVAPRPVQQVEPPKRKKSRAAAILAFLLLLAVVGAAALGWLWYQQNGRVDNLESDLSQARNDLARLESSAKAEKKMDSSDSIADTTNNEIDAIIEAALVYEKAKTATSSTALEASFEKKTNTFARAAVSAPASGSGAVVVYLKKVQSVWVVIGDSTSEFEALKKDFGITDEMLTAK